MIVELSWERAIYVSTRMREDDLREVMASRWNNNPYDFAAECMRLPGVKMACIDSHGIPVAIGGIAVHLPKIGQAWLIGTDAIGQHGIEIAHTCKNLIRRLLSNGDLHRVQAFSASFHTQAHQWMKAIGLSEESRMPCYGKSKEEFVTFSIIREM